MLIRESMGPASDDLALLAARRARIMERMGGGVMLLAAAPERPRTADILYPYRQDSDFAYVTGFPEPEAVCVLAPDLKEHFVLFVRARDPEREQWVGTRAGVEGAVERYGADAAFKLEDLERELPRFLEKAPQVWHTVRRDDPLAQRLMALIRRAQEMQPRTGIGPTTIRDPGDLLHEMRLRKEPAELACMREAIAIACEAHREAMRTARPGMYEYEIEALIDFTFRRRGAAGPAYPSIVASGANATVLHYTDNDRPLGERELLLIDAGAERAGYCADVTRTMPTGRRYEPAQRDLYDAVLAAQLAAIAAVAPGTTLEAVHKTALRVLAEALIAHGVLHGTVDEVLEKETYKRFYMHRTSHWLGRDVHDVGRYAENGAPRALEPGVVLADWGAEVVKIEPPDGDPFRGLYLAVSGAELPANPPFELDNRGKRSIALDLRTEDGRRIAAELIERTDVFVTNVRPEILESFGLDDTRLRAQNPRLVYARVTGYGESGPDRDRPAYDIGAFWSRAGIAAALTPPGSDPPYQRGAMGDHVAGMTLAGGVAAALLAREKSGAGQMVTTSLLRVGVFVLGWDTSATLRLGIPATPMTRTSTPNPVISCYRAGDGRWFWLLGLQGQRHWPDLLRAVERPDWLEDPRFATMRSRRENCPELVRLLDQIFATRPLAEWGAIFDRAGMWWAPVQTTEDVVRDPQAIAAGAFVDVPQPDGTQIPGVASPVDFSVDRWAPQGPVPEVGQHTEEILLELGYDWERIAGLKERGAIP